MNETLKSGFISRWKKYFHEAPLPVALFYSNNLHNAEPAKSHAGHHCIIADITKVFNGQTVAFNLTNIGCGGGLRYCGFADTLRPNFLLSGFLISLRKSLRLTLISNVWNIAFDGHRFTRQASR